MPKGPIVPESIKVEIARIYLEAQDKGEYLSGKEVRERLRKFLGKRERLPGLRKVQEVLAAVRKSQPALKEQDAPWSLGVCDRIGIPADATKDLLDIWVWSIVVGYKFSIREAKWVARLRNVIALNLGKEDFLRLHYYAAFYASRQRAAEALDLDPEYTEP